MHLQQLKLPAWSEFTFYNGKNRSCGCFTCWMEAYAETLIRFLILLHIFIRCYHRTLEKGFFNSSLLASLFMHTIILIYACSIYVYTCVCMGAEGGGIYVCTSLLLFLSSTFSHKYLCMCMFYGWLNCCIVVLAKSEDWIWIGLILAKRTEERMVACVQDSSDSNAFRCVLPFLGVGDAFDFNYLNLFFCSFFSCICNYGLVLICLLILYTHQYF